MRCKGTRKTSGIKFTNTVVKREGKSGLVATKLSKFFIENTVNDRQSSCFVGEVKEGKIYGSL